MNSKDQNTSLFQKDQVMESLKQSFVKLNPKMMVKNPIMFTVEVSTVIMGFVTVYSAFSTSQGSFTYNLWIFVILFLTLLFANFAEAIAEARGKAQARRYRYPSARQDRNHHHRQPEGYRFLSGCRS